MPPAKALAPLRGVPIFLLLLSAIAPAEQLTGETVLVESGNVVLRTPSGVEHRLTHAGRDANPTLSPDGRRVAFVRTQPGPVIWNARGDVEQQEIWIVGVDGRGARRLARNARKVGTATAFSAFYELQFSPGGHLLYFQTGCAMVHGCLHSIDLRSGKTRLVSGNVNGAEVLRSGRYAGHLLVQAHQYCTGDDPPCGSYEEIWLITPEGKTVHDIGPGELAPGNETVARFKRFGAFPGPRAFAAEQAQ